MENQENTTINERKVCEKCGQKNSVDNEFCFYCRNVFAQENKKNTVIIEEDSSEKNIEKNNINSNHNSNDANILTKENKESLTTIEGKYCEKCSFHNNIDNNFCSNCGNIFNQENQQKNNSTEEIKDEKTAFTKKKIFTTILIIIATLPLWWGGIIGICIALACIIAYISKEEPKNTDITQNKIINNDNIICEKCGTQNNINNSFCINCQNELNQEKQQESNSTEEIVVENRELITGTKILRGTQIIMGATETLFQTIGTIIWSGLIIMGILFGTCLLFAGLGSM